jgi:hypothetical protein
MRKRKYSRRCILAIHSLYIKKDAFRYIHMPPAHNKAWREVPMVEMEVDVGTALCLSFRLFVSPRALGLSLSPLMFTHPPRPNGEWG